MKRPRNTRRANLFLSGKNLSQQYLFKVQNFAKSFVALSLSSNVCGNSVKVLLKILEVLNDLEIKCGPELGH
jgi:hypothetical protein